MPVVGRAWASLGERSGIEDVAEDHQEGQGPR
jgi:hypothetical protein